MKMTIVLLVVLGIVAGVCAVFLVGAVQSKGARNRTDVTVVQAARNLPKGTRLTADDLKTGTVKQHELSSNRYMANLGLVVNRTLSEDIVQDGILYSYHFESGGSIAELVSKLEPGMRAVSISLSTSQVTGALLYPGCVVDVLASFQLRGGYGSEEGKGEAVSTTLLERIEVLAIQGQLEDTKDEEKEKGPSRSVRSSSRITVTLLLDTKQAEALQVAAVNGLLSVSMRSPLDEQAIDPNPTVLNRGKLSRRGMLIDPIVQRQGEGMPPGSENVFDPEASNWEVKVIRGSKVSDEEIRTAE